MSWTTAIEPRGLTGQVRFRSERRRGRERLILQLEERISRVSLIGVSGEHDLGVRWRDAELTDFRTRALSLKAAS